MQVENIKTDIIKPYWRNARDNSKTIAALKQSITDFGFNQPLVLDKKFTIIAGHARYTAMLELGAEEIPCIVVEMDPVKVKQYRIADNKTHEMTSWVHDELLVELRELSDWKDLDIFFPNVDVQSWLQESVGQAIKEVTDEDVRGQLEKNEKTFEESTDAVMADQLEVICPHCAENFYVSRREVTKRMDM